MDTPALPPLPLTARINKKVILIVIIIVLGVVLVSGIYLWFMLDNIITTTPTPIKATPNTAVSPASQGFIRVLDQRGGNVFSQGGTMKIEWEGSGPAFVDIYLEQSADIKYKIAQALPFNSFSKAKDESTQRGAFIYTVGEKLDYPYGRTAQDTDVQPGSYKIKIIGQMTGQDIEGVSSGLIYIQKGGNASLTTMTCPYGIRSGSCATADQYVKIVRPNGKETLCLGQETQIMWKHKGMKTVNLSLRYGNMSYPIAIYPADFNETGAVGEGTVVWKVGATQAGSPMKEGFAYEMMAQSTVGEPVGYTFYDVSDNVFSIVKCDG